MKIPTMNMANFLINFSMSIERLLGNKLENLVGHFQKLQVQNIQRMQNARNALRQKLKNSRYQNMFPENDNEFVEFKIESVNSDLDGTYHSITMDGSLCFGFESNTIVPQVGQV